jgi:hypothetical protein
VAGKRPRQTRGQHQVPDQAGQDQREAAPAQQVRALGPCAPPCASSREAVEAGKTEEAAELQRAASRALDKAASKGVIHKNQAANRKSAMAKRINSAA